MTMKIPSTLGIITLALALAACSSATKQSQQSSSSSAPLEVASSSSAAIDLKELYRYYESKELGVSLYVAAYYAYPRTVTGGVMEVDQQKIVYNSFSILDSDTAGEPGYISITKTTDPHMVEFLSQYHPLETKVINGVKMQKYKFDGVANPEGFIQKIKGEYVIVEFTFEPSEIEMERVMASMKLF